MKFSKDMKDGLMVFAMFATHVDQLYFAYLQSLLDESVTKLPSNAGQKEKSSSAAKKVRSYDLR